MVYGICTHTLSVTGIYAAITLIPPSLMNSQRITFSRVLRVQMLLCESCHAEHDGLYGGGRFCSAKCARGFSTAAKREEINKQVSQQLSGRSNPHPSCSETLQKLHQGARQYFAKRFLDWVIPWSLGNVEPLGWFNVRKGLIYLRGERCEKCSWAEHHPISNVIPVQVHHIDGNDKNNVYINLKLLCPNCHSLTPNFMAYNRQSFKDKKLAGRG